MAKEKFQRPLQFVQGQDVFSATEVGLNHQNTPGFIRLKDNGDIEIMACDGCGIILHPAKKRIVLVGDSIQFMTKNGMQGLVWNKQAFNENADTFNEPALVPVSDEDAYSPYKGVEHFLYGATSDSGNNDAPMLPLGMPNELIQQFNAYQNKDAYPQTMVTDPESGEQISYEDYYVKYKRPPTFGSSVGS